MPQSACDVLQNRKKTTRLSRINVNVALFRTTAQITRGASHEQDLKLNEYFEKPQGIGVLATTDASGRTCLITATKYRATNSIMRRSLQE